MTSIRVISASSLASFPKTVQIHIDAQLTTLYFPRPPSPLCFSPMFGTSLSSQVLSRSLKEVLMKRLAVLVVGFALLVSTTGCYCWSPMFGGPGQYGCGPGGCGVGAPMGAPTSYYPSYNSTIQASGPIASPISGTVPIVAPVQTTVLLPQALPTY